MSTEFIPKIGDWYKYDTGTEFEIVAIDNDRGNIEVQYFDGTVEELDADLWYEQNIIAIEPPEDWSGSMDMELDDYGVDLETSTHLAHGSPLDDV